MSVKKSRTTHLTTTTSRQWVSKAAMLLLMVMSLTLMLISQTGNTTVSRIRVTLIDILTPIISVASKPLDAVANTGIWINEMTQLRSDNIALKNANTQLMQWQSIAKNMEAENNSLRLLMNAVSIPKNNYITARIVTDMGGPYVRSALIGGGLSQGIKKDQAVISEQGLVGRIVETGDKSSRVLLLSDINSHIPVMSESSHKKTILVGNNNELPSLSYTTSDSTIKVGERIITSGDGGVFPRGIAVGVVTKIEKGIIRVQPFVDATNIEYVSIVDYSL
jgi:rod shape-determining protein MreC